MKDPSSGEPRGKPTKNCAVVGTATKKPRDLIRLIRRGIARILEGADAVELEIDDVDDIGLLCSSEIDGITATAKHVLSLAEELAARVEPFVRKRKNRIRDEKIVRMRDADRQSFGQIGFELGLSPDGVRKAYQRHKADKSNRLRKT